VLSKLHYPRWPDALEAARKGDLELARAGQAQEAAAQAAESMLADGIFGRCLAEAGEALDGAVTLISRSLQHDPANPLLPHALALALARRGEAGDASRALDLWQRYGLPHDLDLLGQTALTFEAQLKPIERSEDYPEPTWPTGLKLIQTPKPESELMGQGETFEPPSSDNLALAGATKPILAPGGFLAGKRHRRELSRLEALVTAHDVWPALQGVGEILNAGRESPELHLLGGVAAEEAGCWERARAHLERLMELEPGQLHGRVMLGRIYWRLGWAELAIALWRSLPVEGPYDSARHYHLALGHAAAGDRSAANAAMRKALSDFFYDTRHGFLQRAWELWQRLPAVEVPSRQEPS
jgi:predicted Zn-dependent protease